MDSENTLYLKNYERYSKNREFLIKEYPLKWLCFNSDGSNFVFEIAAAALASRNDNDSFVVCVGGENLHVL